MSKISEVTKYLFDCDFFAEEFDENDTYEHYDCAQKLMEENKWDEIYDAWYDYLINCCQTPDSVINYVNLYIYYGGQDQAIRNPYEFLGYIYCMVNMDQYWDSVGELFDGLSINILENCGKANIVKNPYYNPEKDPKLLESIQEWRKRMYG